MNGGLSSYVGEYKKYFILAPLMTIIETSAELVLPLLMGMIIDRSIPAHDRISIGCFGGLMAVVALVGLAAGVLSGWYSALGAQGFGANARSAMFQKIQQFSFADIDHFSTASLVTRCTSDIRQVQDMAQQILRILVKAPTLLVVSLLICTRLNLRLSGVYATATPILLALILVILHLTRPIYGLMQRRLDALNAVVQEDTIGVRVVKTYVREELENERFNAANTGVKDTAIFAGVRTALMRPCSTAIFNVAALALYWLGGHAVAAGEMDKGAFMTFVSFLHNIMFSVILFTSVLSQYARVQVCAARLREVLDREPDIRSGSAGEEPSEGSVEFRNVSFRYGRMSEGSYAVRDVSFQVAPGEFVAIIGRTGSGKSSLVDLIPRFYDATEGQVLVDGRDVREYDLGELRGRIGVVLQNNRLFSGSLRDNLQWGCPEAEDEALAQTLRDAQIGELLEGEGLDRRIEQRGANVSGGQKQRLCIARALAKKPSILILDDSSSALDALTVARLQENLRKRISGVTILLVAQRISSVRNADRILVMEEGRLQAVGTHEELLRSDPVYQAICASQMKGGEDRG